MDQLAAHQRAQDALSRALGAVAPSHLDAPTPCEQWTVRQLVDHVIAGNYRMAGTTPPAAPDGDVADLVSALSASADAAQRAFAAPDGLTRMIDMPFGPVPGEVVIGMRTTDALVHAWDVARAAGQSTDIEPDLAEATLQAVGSRVTDEARGPGRPFGPERPCAADRPAADRLAAFLGRSVD